MEPRGGLAEHYGTRTLDEVLTGLSVPGAGGDASAVAGAIDAMLVTRRRRSRILATAAAVVALLVGLVVAGALDSEDPEEVVSADGTSTTLEPATGSGTVLTAIPTTTLPVPIATLPAPLVPPPVTTPVPPPTAAPVAPPAAPSPGSSGSSSPAPQPAPTSAPTSAPAPLVAELRLPTSVAAGEVLPLTVTWSDADLPRGAVPTVRVVASPAAGTAGRVEAGTTASGSCTGPAGAEGTVTTGVRLPAGGKWAVGVELSACGERDTLLATVTVDPVPGRRGITAHADGLQPEQGTWTFLPAGGGTVELRNPPPGTPGVAQVHDGRPATVVMVPEDAGVLRHVVAGCTRDADLAAGSTPQPVKMGACT